MTARRKVSLTVFFVSSFLAGVLFTTAGANWIDLGEGIGQPSIASSSTHATTESVTNDLVNADKFSIAAIDDIFVSVADRVNPSVVQIHSEVIQERQVVNPFDGLFNFPFQNNPNVPNTPTPPSEFRTSALGSGVLISKDGHIATNYHVINGAAELEVMTYDGQYYKAEVVGTDPNSDLAVIKIEKTGLPAIEFASPNDIRVGQWVMAFGSPLAEELGNTVTSGIVSAVRRNSSTLAGLNLFSAFIQTDAAINPGNSGGPLVNLHGNLIGLNSAIISRSGGNQGIGFAIPVDVVQNITSQLMKTGTVERGFLGVNFDRVSNSLAKALDVPRGAAQVTSVTKGAPADDAGVQEGDIIIAVNNTTLNDFNELRTTIANLPPGERVRLEIARNQARKTIEVKLGKRSTFVNDASAGPQARPEKDAGMVASLGLQLEDLTPQIIQRLNVDTDIKAGLFVSSVDPNSTAYREGDLRQGDIITEVNRKPVSSRADFLAAIEDLEKGDTFLVRAYRKSQDPDGSSVMRLFLTALTKPQ